MFQLSDPKWIWCSQCLVLKHYSYLKDDNNKKIPETDPDFKLRRREDGKLIGRKWQTEGTYLTRTFPIARRKNPLAYSFETVIKNCKTEYLIPAELHFNRGFSKTESASDKYVYKKIREIDVNNLVHVNNVDRRGNVIGIEDGLFPHLLRSQCASYLADELGASAYQLKEFFQWSSLEMSANYVETSRSARNLLLDKSSV
jgi:hypothetical protein